MTSCSECNRLNTNGSSVLGQITFYKYGKLITPGPIHSRRPKPRRGPRYTKGSTNFDRASLIAKIHHLLDIHRTQRQRNSFRSTRCSPYIHRALQQAIRNCFEENIFDSNLYPVGDLFLELFRCVGNTYAIFSILMGDHVSCTSQLMNNGVNILYPKHVGNDDNSTLAYYLHHVSNLRDEEYEWNHGTYLDLVNQEIDHYSGQTPLSAAVQKRDPALVLTLLRYGADPFKRTTETTFIEDRDCNPTDQLIDDLNGLHLFKNTGFSVETREKLAAEEAKVLLCLTYFCRAVPSIRLTTSSHVVTFTEEEDDEPDSSDTAKPETSKAYNLHPTIADELDMDFFKPTASLKHLCRCAVRRRLRENRHRMISLPRGIAVLPLPKQLKEFVDLQTD